MKKIVMDNGDIRFGGEAGVNSVSFIGYIQKGVLSIETREIVARLNENGNISCDYLEKYRAEHSMLYKTITEMKNKYAKAFFAIAMVMFSLSLVTIFVCPQLSNPVYGIFLFFFGCALGAGQTGMFFEMLKRNEKIISLMKFHSAEHAVINAYYDLHRVPTLDEIRNYSRFSYNCGSLNEMIFVFTFWILAIAKFLTDMWIIVFLAILFMDMFYFKKKKRLFFMEFLVTAKPTDKEYKVAIAGLEAALQEVNNMPIKVRVDEIIAGMPVAVAVIIGESFNHDFSEESCKECPLYNSCKEKAQKNKD